MSATAFGEGHDLRFAKIDANTTGGDNTVLPADTAGRRIRVVAYTLIAAAGTSVVFKTANTAISGTMQIASNGGISANGTPSLPLMQTNPNEALVITLGAGAVGGHLSYVLE